MDCTVRIYDGNYEFLFFFTEYLVIEDNYGLHAYVQSKTKTRTSGKGLRKTREIYLERLA